MTKNKRNMFQYICLFISILVFLVVATAIQYFIFRSISRIYQYQDLEALTTIKPQISTVTIEPHINTTTIKSQITTTTDNCINEYKVQCQDEDKKDIAFHNLFHKENKINSKCNPKSVIKDTKNRILIESLDDMNYFDSENPIGYYCDYEIKKLKNITNSTELIFKISLKESPKYLLVCDDVTRSLSDFGNRNMLVNFLTTFNIPHSLYFNKDGKEVYWSLYEVNTQILQSLKIN